MWRHAKASISQYGPKKNVFGGYISKSVLMKRLRCHKLDINGFFKKTDELNDPLLNNEITNNDDNNDSSDFNSECSDTLTTETDL